MEKQDKVQKKLLYWGKDNIKSYPWRNTSDPYKILISEILLHKTDSKKVKKVYPIFIKKFPTIYDLYEAKEEEINVVFKDIGLFYRAQRLKEIAKQTVSNFNGNIPNRKKELLSFCGVGDYISNAVLCFSFKKKMPIVDTNIVRVYERVFSIKSSKVRPRTDKKIWDFAENMLPRNSYVEYNYSLLDFASEICKAKKPLCNICPVKNICEYKKEEDKDDS